MGSTRNKFSNVDGTTTLPQKRHIYFSPLPGAKYVLPHGFSVVVMESYSSYETVRRVTLARYLRALVFNTNHKKRTSESGGMVP